MNKVILPTLLIAGVMAAMLLYYIVYLVIQSLRSIDVERMLAIEMKSLDARVEEARAGIEFDTGEEGGEAEV